MNIKYQKDYDVVVAGGGLAGVAAAVAASRRGMKTVLIEKTVFPGGLATTGLIFVYLPICDGNGSQLCFGLAEELLKASIKYGPGDVPGNWHNEVDAIESKRYMAAFSPASFIIAMDEILTNAGVDVWYDTVICATNTENRKVSNIEVENKSGRGLINGKCFVDATGDADLAFQAGANCPIADNAIASWVLEYEERKENTKGLGENCYVKPAGTNIDQKWAREGINGELVSRFILESREQYRKTLTEEYAEGKHNRKTHFPLSLPAMAQFRTTRRIDGISTLTDGQEWTHFDDSIGMVGDWRKSGSVWEIPYSSLVPKDLKGLLAAGRCISSEKDAWEVTRVIPTAVLTGEVTGIAAAMSTSKEISPDELDYKDLQKELKENYNFPLHVEDLGIKAKN